jgi:hypothetical protein
MMNTDLSQSSLTPAQEQAVQSYLAGAIAAGPGLAPGQFVGEIIYTPTDLSTGGPQEFFGSDPPAVSEPSALTILGSGLFSFGMLIRRKMG